MNQMAIALHHTRHWVLSLLRALSNAMITRSLTESARLSPISETALHGDTKKHILIVADEWHPLDEPLAYSGHIS